MKWQPNECRAGDMVRVRLGSIYHYGIFVSEDEVIQFGLPPTPQNLAKNKDFTVCTTSVYEFSCGNIVEKAVFSFKERLKKFSRAKTVKNAISHLGEGGYNLIHNNCEHFVYLCVFGEKRSTQEEEARKRWSNRPVLDVYVMPIPSQVQITPVYPKARNAEIEKCQSLELKNAKYCVWQLLLLAAEKSLGLKAKDIRFKKSKGGKWYAKNMCFSLSHTDTAVAVAISKQAVGVDIESVSGFSGKAKRLPSLCEKVLTRREKGVNGADSVLGFLRLWTKKEAIFKAGNAKSFVPCDIETESFTTATHIINAPNEAVVSVCSESAEKARYYIVNESTVTTAQKKRLEAET